MASWNNPALANKISDDVPAIKALLAALFKWTDSGTENVPTDAKRLHAVSGGRQIQEYVGSPLSWASVGKLMHDVDTLDGKHATVSATADTIPVRDSYGRIAGDILGNANTATTASGLASNYRVPVANGGTGATTEAGAREMLGCNNAANIDQGVLGVAHGGTGSSVMNFVDLSSAQTIGGNKTFSGEVTLNRNVLKMTVLDTTENATTTRTDTVLQGISSNSAYGISAMFGTNGNAIVGAGEGKASLLAELAGNAGEDVYIIADGVIHFHPNANTYANRKNILLNAAGELSGLAKVTAASFVGPLTGSVTGNCSGSSGSCTGNAATATKLATTRNFYVADNSATNTGPASSFQGTGNCTIKLPATIKANITGNCSGSSGSCTGNAATATKLATARTINGVAFNGTANITIPVASGSTIANPTLTGTTVVKSNGLRMISDVSAKGTANTQAGHYYMFYDKNTKELACVYFGYDNSKNTFSLLRAYKANASGDTANCSCGMYYLANGTRAFRPSENNTVILGYEGYKFKEFYCGNATIHTSDARLKDGIKDVPDSLLDAWEGIGWRTFAFKDAVREKGAKARVHAGLVAQEVEEAFRKAGLDASRHAFFCHHSWSARAEIKDRDGNVAEPARKAGDEYALRYEEALCIEAAYQRRRAGRAERRLEDLERRISALEQTA